MADYDTWKKVGRYVKRGAKGCAIFPSRALNPRMRYIFDISDTGGKNVKLTCLSFLIFKNRKNRAKII